MSRKPVACNIGAGGYTEREIESLIHLTEPQGKIKNLQQRRRRIYGDALDNSSNNRYFSAR